jgi:hypothetical protein
MKGKILNFMKLILNILVLIVILFVKKIPRKIFMIIEIGIILILLKKKRK